MSNITEREIQKKAELLGPGSVWESTRGSRYTPIRTYARSDRLRKRKFRCPRSRKQR